MRELKGMRYPARSTRLQAVLVSNIMLMVFLAIIAGTMLSYSSSDITEPKYHPFAAPLVSKTVVMNGADNWNGDEEVTTPGYDFSSPASQKTSISPLFEHYYASHSGSKNLGTPLTVAFPTDQGWIQFFESGALLMPTVHKKLTHDASDPLSALITTGMTDLSTGIMRIPLLQALLTVGSLVPVDGGGSSLTYVDLRKATNPNLMFAAPKASSAAASSLAENQAVFIKGGTRAGKDVGHLIPQIFWSYINRSAISPDGWETDFGDPLTEALAFTVTKDGSTHHMLVQAFWRDGLLLDQDTFDASGQPLVQRLNTGVAYLRTVGPPTVALSAQQTIWAQGDTTLLNAPGTGHPIAHVGQYFPLTPLGDIDWIKGMLWYHVQWVAPKHKGSGWVGASAITFTSPGDVSGWASFDVLSPDLAAYLAGIGGDVGAVVYDVAHQRYYSYNANTQFITGSSIKVPIMLTFLDMIEQQERQPDNDEMNLLTTMIENSNNDSAEILYHDEIGDAAGVASYMDRLGISGLNPYPFAFGWSLVTPLTMVNLLMRLDKGTILTGYHRDLALNLMEHIESDQQVGVGDTAPGGATVAMKDGWVPAPDGLWAMNSSGIVTSGQETYIISVYTRDQNSLGDEYAIVQHICGTVASLLI